MQSSDPTGSGTTLATSSAAAVSVLALGVAKKVTLYLETAGGVACYFSLDAGDTWAAWPVGSDGTPARSLSLSHVYVSGTIKIKRASGTDVTGIKAWAFELWD